MNAYSWAERILFGDSLDDKLYCPDFITFERVTHGLTIPIMPARNRDIQISNDKMKFPKARTFYDPKKRVIALHSFANHELMAIEIFAAFIVLFPVHEPHFKHFQQHLVQTLKEEQKHFSLYRAKIEKMGSYFGDYPINDFFWKLIRNIKTPREFFSVVSLSLEAANLDFSKYYGGIFKEFEDFEAAQIMNIIYTDEIKHVALGRHYLEQELSAEETLWELYRKELPDKFSPARAKGIVFDHEGRKKAGLDDNYIKSSFEYRDNFSVVNRKQWKK